MKTKLFLVAFATSVTFAACGDSNNESTTATDSTTSTTNTTMDATTSTDTSGASMSQQSGSSFDESVSYVDLKTNKPVRLKRNEGSEYLYDYETNKPYSYFFYNPATNDTFDRSGNVVNNYLMKGSDGSYTVDEKRWKVKVDKDGDIKMKDGDDTKIKAGASSGKTKLKTGDTTIKE